MTLVSLAVVYLLLYGRPSALEGGLLLPYTTHVSGERTVALTFDDGPDPVYTPQVLEVLTQYDVKATFFVIGRHVDAHPELVRRIVAAGHAVGSHGYSHAILRGVWPGEIATELRQTDAALWRAAGIRTRLFRHPGGMQGAFLPFVALAGGWRVVVWSVDPCDYTTPGAEEIARRVLEAVHPGAIVLLHDGSPGGNQSRQQTVAALPTILEGLRERGYRFVRLELRRRGRKKESPCPPRCRHAGFYVSR
jgi:peptidoglycan/xylan/chitin deacetylase (PgdA/CDA1 family)